MVVLEVFDNVNKIIQSYGHTHYLYKQSAVSDKFLPV